MQRSCGKGVLDSRFRGNDGVGSGMTGWVREWQDEFLTGPNPYPIIAFAAPLLTTLPALEVQLWQSNPSASA